MVQSTGHLTVVIRIADNQAKNAFLSRRAQSAEFILSVAEWTQGRFCRDVWLRKVIALRSRADLSASVEMTKGIKYPGSNYFDILHSLFDTCPEQGRRIRYSLFVISANPPANVGCDESRQLWERKLMTE
jgi:hypothetical protein